MTARVVQEAIRQLPPEQREVVELAYFGGRSHSEVAAALGISVGTAKGRLRLAYSKLRRLLAPEMAEMA
jgi:RNA polymerase sigma-70 factor (ECF subfamily)